MKNKLKKIIIATFVMAVVVIIGTTPVMAATKTTQSTTTKKAKKQKTSKAYKKYVGKWETVNYTLKIKVVNKNYLKATITEKGGDQITIDKKMNVKKKNTVKVVSKKGKSVKVIIKLEYGKAYTSYGGGVVRDGPCVYLEGDNQAWSRNSYHAVKKGKRVPALLVYQRDVKK